MLLEFIRLPKKINIFFRNLIWILLDRLQSNNVRLDLDDIVPSMEFLKALAGKVAAIAISASNRHWTGDFLPEGDIRDAQTNENQDHVFDSNTKSALKALLSSRCS